VSETAEDFGPAPEGTAARWKEEIANFEDERQDWRDRVERIEARYRDERNHNDAERRFALLWANLEVLQPTLYARDPKPEVARRFKDRDPVGRVMATIIERNLTVAMERGQGAFGRTMRAVVKDFLIGGQGVAWCRYEVQFADDVDGAGAPTVKDEAAVPDYVHWRDFGCTAGARIWDEVTAVWRKSFLTRDQLTERFGDETARDVPLDCKDGGGDGDHDSDDAETTYAKATIYEIWDRDAREITWLHTGMDAPLDTKPYPDWLLTGFPCPPPLFGTLTNGTLTPVPDYVQYQDQASELDDLTGRIATLTSALRLAGFVPGDMAGDVQRALELGGEAKVIPVKSWAVFGGQKLGDLIVWLPIEAVAATLKGLQELRQKVKEDAYEVTGLSDILRGSSQASETATAQQLKAQWGSVRVRWRQADVQRFAADLLRLMAMAIVALYDIETLAEAANVQGMPPADQQYVLPALQLLKQGGILTAYRIDIETDSTIAADQIAEKQSWTELLGGVAQFFGAFGPILQGVHVMAPQAMPAFTAMCGELLIGAVRRFSAGPAVEASIEAAFEALGQASAQAGPPGQQGPDPVEMAKHQVDAAKLQVEQQKTQVAAQKVQAEGQRTQADMAIAAQEHQHRMASLQADSAHANADRQVQMASLQSDNAHQHAQRASDGAHANADRELQVMQLAQQAREAAMQAATPKPKPK
jgi:hypothetical protein